MYIAELSGPLPRAFVLSASQAEAETALRQELRPRVEAAAVIAGGLRLPWHPARITRYEPERVEIEANSDGKAFLVLSDLFHPFWTASVDGRPVEIFPVFSILRGVRLEAGRHTVRFTCGVPLMRLAWLITAGALLAIALGWVAIRPAPSRGDSSS